MPTAETTDVRCAVRFLLYDRSGLGREKLFVSQIGLIEAGRRGQGATDGVCVGTSVGQALRQMGCSPQ
jgi:hypothetical protein